MTQPQIQFTPLTSIAQVASQIFAALHQAILAQEAGVLDRDVEAVHDMRVAVRRLRVALSNFAACCEPSGRRRMRSLLNQLADALGNARDLDVLIEDVKKYQTRIEINERPQIAALIRRLQARRLRRYHRLVAFLQSEDYLEFKLEFLSAIKLAHEPADTTAHQETDGQSTQSQESFT